MEIPEEKEVSPLNLLIVEDDREMRESFEMYFSRDTSRFATVHAFESAENLLGAATLPQPVVILLDINLPGMTGIEAIPLLRQKFGAPEILMISVLSDSQSVFSAICAGASGYIDKETPLPAIKEAILHVREGGSPITPAIARKVFDYFQPKKESTSGLSEREREVVKGIIDGLSYKLIADRLEISINTVRKYIRQIYDKLQINSKGELLAKYHPSSGNSSFNNA